MSNSPAVKVPPAMMVANNEVAATPFRLVEIGTVETMGKIAAVLTVVAAIAAAVLPVTPTASVTVLDPAKAVVILTKALSTRYVTGVDPNVIVSVSDATQSEYSTLNL